jgi:hypothetical protein
LAYFDANGFLDYLRQRTGSWQTKKSVGRFSAEAQLIKVRSFPHLTFASCKLATSSVVGMLQRSLNWSAVVGSSAADGG